MASVSQFSCVQLYGFHGSFLIVFFLILKINLDLNIWWLLPVCSCATNVHLIPASGDNEVYHMTVSRAWMRPCRLVCILLFEHGVGHYHINLSV